MGKTADALGGRYRTAWLKSSSGRGGKLAEITKEKARNAGVATAVLDHALKSARESGYERCAVSFEPMNLLGTRFWLKYFKPVCFSVVRYIDERVVNGKLT